MSANYRYIIIYLKDKYTRRYRIDAGLVLVIILEMALVTSLEKVHPASIDGSDDTDG